MDFRGRIRAFANFDVELDADRNILKRGDPTDVIDTWDPSDDSIYCASCKVEIWRKARAVTFLPTEGTVLVCDFSTGFRLPEMIERRPCIRWLLPFVSSFRPRRTCSR